MVRASGWRGTTGDAEGNRVIAIVLRAANSIRLIRRVRVSDGDAPLIGVGQVRIGRVVDEPALHHQGRVGVDGIAREDWRVPEARGGVQQGKRSAWGLRSYPGRATSEEIAALVDGVDDVGVGG